ncbi:MAG: hypothetical protein IJJ14_08470 [Coriobacteriales bacterium]|nr:hypothetical protein [Coriobacteriales bacterium]MBQ6585638.1 hypothetical protein [Coriobacteriales bacterium]
MKKLTRRGFIAALTGAALGLTGCRVFTPEAVYGPPPEDVYGPPSDFDPENNVVETVYGPPEDLGYDPVENEPEDVYGPPSDFDPDDNVPEAVYGPPSMFR